MILIPGYLLRDCGLSPEWLLSFSHQLLCCEALYAEIQVARKWGRLLINTLRGTEVLSLKTCKELILSTIMWVCLETDFSPSQAFRWDDSLNL